jgi:hypothetical protein
MRTPEQNEALLHREVERAQARRWEPEDDDEQPESIRCAWCHCDMERGSGYTAFPDEECCSEVCRKEYVDHVAGEINE